MLRAENDLLKEENNICIEVTAANWLPSAHWLHVDRVEEES